MAAETVDAGSGHPAFAGLALIQQALDQVQQSPAWTLDDRQVTALIVGLTEVAARSEAARAAVLRESVSREVPDARGEQGARTVNLLKVPVPGLTEAGVGGRGEREADLPRTPGPCASWVRRWPRVRCRGSTSTSAGRR